MAWAADDARRRPRWWARLHSVAGSLQALGGVFLGSHAVAEGVVTRTQLQSGLYRRLFHNVYADPGLPADHRLYARGAALGMPSDAVLGGRSAAAWFDAPFATPVEARVIVEYEGAHHFAGLQIRRDDERYERLVADGWRVIRFSSADLRDLADVIARIAATLGRQAS